MGVLGICVVRKYSTGCSRKGTTHMVRAFTVYYSILTYTQCNTVRKHR